MEIYLDDGFLASRPSDPTSKVAAIKYQSELNTYVPCIAAYPVAYACHRNMRFFTRADGPKIRRKFRPFKYVSHIVFNESWPCWDIYFEGRRDRERHFYALVPYSAAPIPAPPIDDRSAQILERVMAWYATTNTEFDIDFS
jgi:hypothetical protein